MASTGNCTTCNGTGTTERPCAHCGTTDQVEGQMIHATAVDTQEEADEDQEEDGICPDCGNYGWLGNDCVNCTANGREGVTYIQIDDPPLGTCPVCEKTGMIGHLCEDCLGVRFEFIMDDENSRMGTDSSENSAPFAKSGM